MASLHEVIKNARDSKMHWAIKDCWKSSSDLSNGYGTSYIYGDWYFSNTTMENSKPTMICFYGKLWTRAYHLSFSFASQIKSQENVSLAKQILKSFSTRCFSSEVYSTYRGLCFQMSWCDETIKLLGRHTVLVWD